MSNIDLRVLISKLHPTCRNTLESAINLSLAQTHYQITLSHWLSKLLEDPQTGVISLLEECGLSATECLHEIKKSLSQLKTGNTQTPAFSPEIVELLREAWTSASIEFSVSAITVGHLFFSLVKNPDLYLRLINLYKPFEQLSSETIKQYLLKNPSENKILSKHSEALDQFTINLTERAKAGKLDDVIGRESEIRQIIDVLSRRRQNNPILVGEAGVGKTAIAEGLAILMAQNNVPPSLKNTEIRMLDLALLQAGASIKGEFENRLKTLIHEVNSSPTPIILFIDEAHTLIGAGNQAGQGDAANLLKPALARGELRIIAATTSAEYKKYFEKDAALTRRFQLIPIQEPDDETTLAILRNLAEKLERHHHVHILDEALVAAVYLSRRYIPDRQLPDKAVSLLDTACARVQINANSTPAPIEALFNQLNHVETSLARLQKELWMGEDTQNKITQLETQKKIIEKSLDKLNKKWKKEVKLYAALQNANEKLLQKKYKQLQQRLITVQGDDPYLPFNINAAVISEIIENWTGIPTGKLNHSEHETLMHLEEKLKARIVGQDHALHLITQSLQISRSNLSDPHKPVGVFFLAGSSGVGKTETALALADLFYGSEKALITINMSEYKEAHKVSLLMGSPPGYVGYGEGGVLTEAVRRKPYSIVLLDEMEKAHPSVQDIFYQVFDKASLMDGEGRRVDFSHTIILMTSNAGSEIITQFSQGTSAPDIKTLDIALQEVLRKTFKPAFLGRTTVIPYLNLSEAMLKQITELQLHKVQQRVAQNYDVQLTFSSELKEKVVSQCQTSDIGARDIDRIIVHDILPILSTFFLKAGGTVKKLTKIQLGVDMQNGFCLVGG